ncbi:MAG: hypothetical protein KC613_22970, partial [Myxococcales bacterium]|nr:hypothetical protein [Myxococcales bacterium]
EQPLSGPAGGKADGKDRGKQVAQFAPVLADPEPAAAPEPEPPPPPPAPLKRPASPRPVDALALNAKERNLEAPEPKASKRRFELSKSEAKPGAEGEPDGGEFRFQAQNVADEKRTAPAETEDREGLKWAEVSEDDFADARRAPPRSELSRSETVALPAQDAANWRDPLAGLDGNTRGPLGGDAGDLDRGLLTDQVHLDLGGARWAALGLRPGDKLLTIDGEPPHRGEALRGRGAPPVLEVERDGRRVVLYPDGSAGTDDAADDAWAADPKPARFLPRMGYFENTYLGRSPEYLRQLRRLDAAFDGPTPYGPATLPPQALDAPEGAGLALSATLDRPSLEQPHRVFLQVALKGSERFGWRRPPLDLVLVVDAALAAAEPETLTKAVTGLMRRLDPRDRLGVVVAQPDGPQVLSDVAELREARRALTRTLVDGVSLRAT